MLKFELASEYPWNFGVVYRIYKIRSSWNITSLEAHVGILSTSKLPSFDFCRGKGIRWLDTDVALLDDRSPNHEPPAVHLMPRKLLHLLVSKRVILLF